jgi:hypothetical protein
MDKKQILAFRVCHTKDHRHYFAFNWSMIWTLIKYKLIWGMSISFTCTKACDREEYFIQFFAE